MGLRIALACPYAWDAPGGVQVHVRQLAAHLRSRGHITLILAPAWTVPSEQDVRIVGRPVRIPFNGSVAPVCPDPRSRRRIRDALAAFGPDLVHVHEPFSPSTGFFATIESPAPVVAVSHTYFERSILFAAFSRAFRGVWRRPAVWLAVSEATAGFLRHHLDPRADIRVVPNGVDVDPFRDAEPADLPPGRRLLFVGRLDRRKGFPVAVKAFGKLADQLRDVLLVVAGDGPDRDAVGALPQGLGKRVVMLGAVPHAELPPYHAASEAFVSPATGRESFGIVLVEAMAAGLPVIATDIPGYREVVRNDVEGLLVAPGDAAGLATAIRRVLTEPGLAERLGRAGRARAERFRWERVVGEIEAVYHDALARRPG